ncbi:MAG: host-nuclease inhibitor Gam family protein [Leptospiraceae bacterium]|nr:host-nuclease inhibitor Gam family protein [Leptospiraceae bacterium]NUM40830.1 host-nuclease inhibitor Gam family protein [Leptospiraceae bacterium]
MKKKTDETLVDLPTNVYKDRADLTMAVASLGETKRERDRIKSETDDQISKLQTALAEQLKPFDAKIQHITAGITHFVAKHKSDLFSDSERTCKLTSGVLQLRTIPESVKTKTSAKFIEKILTENGLLESFNKFLTKLSGLFIRVKLELNKEQILADKQGAKKKIGIEFNKESERLYIKPGETDAEIESEMEEAA